MLLLSDEQALYERCKMVKKTCLMKFHAFPKGISVDILIQNLTLVYHVHFLRRRTVIEGSPHHLDMPIARISLFLSHHHFLLAIALF